METTTGFTFEAHFIRSKHGSRSLIVNGAKFVKDRTTNETINWRCSNFIRFKCKARAITRFINGREMVKLSRPTHTHIIDGGAVPKVEEVDSMILCEEYYLNETV